MQKARRVPFQSSGIGLCPTGSTRVRMSCYDGLDVQRDDVLVNRWGTSDPIGSLVGRPKERMCRNIIGTPAGWQSRNNKSAPGERVHYDRHVLRTTRPSKKTKTKTKKRLQLLLQYHRPLSRPRLPDCIRTSPKINRPA